MNFCVQIFSPLANEKLIFWREILWKNSFPVLANNCVDLILGNDCFVFSKQIVFISLNQWIENLVVLHSLKRIINEKWIFTGSHQSSDTKKNYQKTHQIIEKTTYRLCICLPLSLISCAIISITMHITSDYSTHIRFYPAT